MTDNEQSVELIVNLIQSARQEWQRASDYALRDLWFESGTAQARADIAAEEAISLLRARGL